MPAWLIQIIVTLAIKFGVPYIVKLFPKIPDQVIDIIDTLLEQLKDPNVSDSSAKKTALYSIKAHCEGVACPPSPKE